MRQLLSWKNWKSFWYTNLITILTLVIGIVLTAWPDILSKICVIFGIVLCIGAVVLFLMHRRSEKPLLYYAVIALVGGILLCIVPTLLKFLIPIFFGGWILISSCSGAYRNYSFRHVHSKWWVGLVLCIIGILIGIFVVTRPMQVMDTTIRLIGIAMIVFSALRLVSAFLGREGYRVAEAESEGRVYETTIEE